MDISFYVLLTLACMVLLLAMWACAASSTAKWGPDLTSELPPHILQEALFGHRKGPSTGLYSRNPVPSAPSELPCAPLLCNEQPMATSKPPLKTFRPAPPRPFSPPAMRNMNNAPVLVLPPRMEPQSKVKSVLYKFSTEEPA